MLLGCIKRICYLIIHVDSFHLSCHKNVEKKKKKKKKKKKQMCDRMAPWSHQNELVMTTPVHLYDAWCHSEF